MGNNATNLCCHVLPVPGIEEGEVDPPYGEMLWQSRTRFKEANRPWDTYTPELQGVLEAAYLAGRKSVEVEIQGATFVVDLKLMRQTNKQQPDRVRDVRRNKVAPQQWFAVNPSAPHDCVPFSEANNRIIEHGTGQRQRGHDAVMMEIEVNGKKYTIDKVRRRQFEKGGGNSDGRFRHVVSVPQGLVRDMGAGGYLRRPLPEESPMYHRLVRAFEKTKHAKNSLRHTDISHSDLKIEGIEYAFSLDRFLMFQHHVARGKARSSDTHRVVIAFHGTRERNHEEIVRKGFDMKRVGKSTGNKGWFGKGIYFSERSFTALGYNYRQERLLACLLSLEKTFQTPLPDNNQNPYHGKDCEEGYDSHYSPTRKELVAFDPKQMLACFILRLNSCNYGDQSRSDYLGSAVEVVVDSDDEGR